MLLKAAGLGFSLEEFSAAAVQGMDGVTISSVCTVFAESEVVGLLNKNIPTENIARALHKTIAKRISAMYKRVDPDSSRVVLTGGSAKNRALHGFLEKVLGMKIATSANSQYAGAIGCAIFAAQIKL